MVHSITDTCKMKREILNIARIFLGGLSALDATVFCQISSSLMESLVLQMFSQNNSSCSQIQL